MDTKPDNSLRVKCAVLHKGEKLCAQIVWIDVLTLTLMRDEDLKKIRLYQKCDLARIMCD